MWLRQRPGTDFVEIPVAEFGEIDCRKRKIIELSHEIAAEYDFSLDMPRDLVD